MIIADLSVAFLANAGLQLAVVGLLVWTTWAQRDFWPFSHYPMFAAYRNAAGVRVFQLRFHLPEGREAALPERAATVAADFSQAFQKRWPDTSPDGADSRAVVREFWQKACRHEPALAGALRIEVVLRAAVIAPTGAIGVTEKALFSIATADFKLG